LETDQVKKISEEGVRPMRGEPTAPNEREVFLPKELFSCIFDLLNEYDVPGMSVWACEELFRAALKAVTYGAVTSTDQLYEEIIKILERSIKIRKKAGRNPGGGPVTGKDVSFGVYESSSCPYPFCHFLL